VTEGRYDGLFGAHVSGHGFARKTSRHCEEEQAAISRFIRTMSCFVYIMSNANHAVLYTGVTNNLCRRVHEHCNGEGSIFTKHYRVKKLVFYDRFDRPGDAIAAEKRIKSGSRAKKIALIEAMNPSWRDLMDDV
jgi:putative endonuclease